MSSLPGGGKAPAPKPIEDVEGEEEPWMTEPARRWPRRRRPNR